MLRRLTADDERFKTVRFEPGLNLLVAEKTGTSRSTDSRNGSGKSSMIELLHFVLGARYDSKHLVARKNLRRVTFTLALDWPGLSEDLHVSRRASDPKQVALTPGLLRISTFDHVAKRNAIPSIFDIFELDDNRAVRFGSGLICD